MLSEKNIIYGFCKATHPPKNKYLISLHRSPELDIIACFTTSKNRTGRTYVEKEHGKIKDGKDNIVSYFFKHGVTIGKNLNGDDFTFPEDTTIVFDYCFQTGEQNAILNNFKDPKVKCVLSDDEYYNLIYAMYKSPHTPKEFIPIFEDKLNKMK